MDLFRSARLCCVLDPQRVRYGNDKAWIIVLRKCFGINPLFPFGWASPTRLGEGGQF